MGVERKSNTFLVISTFVLLVIIVNHAVADLGDGLIAYYPFNGNANDESGYSHNGTVYGAILTTDRFGNPNSAYNFDGNNDYIDAGDSTLTLFDSWNSFTLAAWINPSESSTFECVVGRHDDRKTTFNYAIGISNSNFVLIADQSYIDSNWLKGSTDLTDDTWYHVVGVYDNKNMTLYVNGKEDGSGVFPAGGVGDPSANLYIGNTGHWSCYPDNRYFEGIIDDVRIYNRALSNSEVCDLYVVPVPGSLLLGSIGLGLAGLKLRKQKEF